MRGAFRTCRREPAAVARTFAFLPPKNSFGSAAATSQGTAIGHAAICSSGKTGLRSSR